LEHMEHPVANPAWPSPDGNDDSDAGSLLSRDDQLEPVLGKAASSEWDTARLGLGRPLPSPTTTTVASAASPGPPPIIPTDLVSKSRAPTRSTYLRASDIKTGLSRRNVAFKASVDEVARNFVRHHPVDPPARSPSEEERHWKNDLMKCDESPDATFERAIMIDIISRHDFGDFLDFACNSQWSHDNIYPRDVDAHIKMLPPRPDLLVAFQSSNLLSEFEMAELLPLAYLISPEISVSRRPHRPFPFFSIELYRGPGGVVSIRQNLHTASQALHNMHEFMEYAGHGRTFFEKVRFYSMVASSRGHEMRVHRAVELGEKEGRISSKYPLGFKFDQVYERRGRYTKGEITTLVKKVLHGYGVETLLPILKRSVLHALEKLRSDPKLHEGMGFVS
jgi:hypothetical protein